MSNDPTGNRQQLMNQLTQILGEGNLQPDIQRQALAVFAKIVSSSTGVGGSPLAAAAAESVPIVGASPVGAAGKRRLVYVHGICQHLSGYSNPWWTALHEFETTAFGDGTLGASRLEVLWSDVVTAHALAASVGAGPVATPAHLQVATEIREAMLDRLDRHALDAGPRTMAGQAPLALADTRSFVNIPGFECVDDFSIYLVSDAVRQEIIDRFIQVVNPLLAAGLEIDIISHSWGTVVAYEGLRQLEAEPVTDGRVRNFFTVGAALSIVPVKLRLRPANQDGKRPAMVGRWVNVNAHGDIVGGPLQGRPYAVDDDFPNVVPFGCGSFLGIINPACAHGSYFEQGNATVNRDIFARFIDLP
jgi:metacaspase-1